MRALLFFHAGLLFAAGWEPLGPYGGPAGFVSVDRANPERVLASSRNGNIFVSITGGRRWSRLPFPRIPGASIETVKIHPKNPSYFLVAVAGETSDYSGLYESRDGGVHWERAKDIGDEAVFSLAFFIPDPNRIAAGTRSGVFLSTDAGKSWRKLFREGQPRPTPVMSLAFDPEDPRLVYAGTTHLPWRTKDEGQNWESIHDGMIDDSDVFSIHVDSKHPEKIHASACSGIYLSDSRGDKWRRVQGIPGTDRRTHIVTEDPAYSQLLFAGTTAGLWKSSDAGSTWRKLNGWVVRSVEFHPQDGRVMYLATQDRGLLKSTTAGFSFEEINEGFTGRPIERLLESASGVAVVALGTSGSPRLHRFVAGQWKVDETAPAFLDAVTHENAIHLRTADGLIRESKTGWEPVATPSAIANVAGGKRLWAVSGKNLLARSSAGKWIPTPLPDGSPVFEIVPGEKNVALRAASGYWYRRADNRWTKFTVPSAGRIFDLALHPQRDGTIFAATASGLMKSDDEGKSWSRIETGLPLGFLHTIVPHPLRAEEWWTSQMGRVYRSTDDGKTWEAMSAELEAALIKRLAIRGSDGALLALTEGQGIHALRFLP